jgi:hypothetical protein
MQTITLYRYNRADGGVTISPVKPDCEYTEMVRLVADDGKVLTNDGEHFSSCVDTDTADGWQEVDAPEEEQPEEHDPDEATTEDYIDALAELGVSE